MKVRGYFNVYNIISHRIPYYYGRIDVNTTNVCDNINPRPRSENENNDFPRLYFIRTT